MHAHFKSRTGCEQRHLPIKIRHCEGVIVKTAALANSSQVFQDLLCD